MAQIDERQVQITLGVIGVGSAPVDFLIHQDRKWVWTASSSMPCPSCGSGWGRRFSNAPSSS